MCGRGFLDRTELASWAGVYDSNEVAMILGQDDFFWSVRLRPNWVDVEPWVLQVRAEPHPPARQKTPIKNERHIALFLIR